MKLQSAVAAANGGCASLGDEPDSQRDCRKGLVRFVASVAILGQGDIVEIDADSIDLIE